MDLPTPAEAATQRNCFGHQQALAAGWTRADIAREIRRRALVVITRGVYVPRETYESLTPRDRRLLVIRAAQVRLGPQWLAARRSAADVLGLPVIGSPPEVPQLLAPAGTARSRARSRHQRLGALCRGDGGSCEGIPMVTPARTVIDIARAEPFRNGVVVADAALRRGLTKQELRECLAQMTRWPGSDKARMVVEFATDLSESPLESISWCACQALHLPRPEQQVEIWCGSELVGRPDGLWREVNTVGQADGFGKYLLDGDRELAWRREKAQANRMEDLGFEVVRWGWEEAWRPEGVLDVRLRRAFERGRHKTLDPRVRLVPTAVRRAAA